MMEFLERFRSNPRLVIWVGAALFVISFGYILARLASPAAATYISSQYFPRPTATPAPPPDKDFDGYPDRTDLCPDHADPVQHDTDRDGWGDVCDIDIDGDGEHNLNDPCPFSRGGACLNAAAVNVNILNPTVLRDPESAGIARIELTTFDSRDGTPVLVNGVIHAASEDPLWSAAGDLTLNLIFSRDVDAGDDPGTLSMQGGQLEIVCPSRDGGVCMGSLQLDILSGGAAVSNPPGCESGDALCAWGVNAAFGGPGLPNVWGAFDEEMNVVRFVTGLPDHPGNPFFTEYSAQAQVSSGQRTAFTSTFPAVDLPVVVQDDANDCTNANREGADCEPFGDLISVTLDPLMVDGDPFLSLTLVVGGDFPSDRRDTYSVYAVFLTLEDNGTPIRQVVDFFPDEGRWSLRLFQSTPDGTLANLVDLPPGLLFSAEGNTAELRLPVVLTVPWTAGISGITSRTFRGTEFLAEDIMRNSLGEAPPVPLMIFQHATGPAEGEPPLIGFPQFEDFLGRFHGYIFFPFPGSALAELLASPAGD